MDWLADTRNQGAIPDADLKWYGEDINAKGEGLKKIALAIPEDVFGQMSMSEFDDIYYTHQITNKMFADLNEAKSWLKS